MGSQPQMQPGGLTAALETLLLGSYGLFPDDLPRVIAEVARGHLGAEEVALLLVDLDQVQLRPFGPGDAMPVDGSPAGLAFQEERPVVQVADGPRRLWLPILDSAERLGVLAITDDSSTSIQDWMVLTALLGELITSKQAYGDTVAGIRRTGRMSLGAELRWALLPPLTFTSPSVTITAILQPSHLVSGDAFDYAVDSRTAAVAVFDAMGHGLEASRIANLAVGGFRHNRRHGTPMPDALAEIDAVIADQIGEARFATGQVAVLDLETGGVEVHTAGHLPPLVLRATGATEVLSVSPGLPLGLGPAEYVPSHVQLQPGDALLTHSDGITEARSPAREEYGLRRLSDRAGELLAAGTRPAEILRLLMREALDFQEGDVRDDATLALLRWQPSAVGLPEVPRIEPIVL